MQDKIGSTIIQKLKKNLNIIFLELKDESSLHTGHNKSAMLGNTHYYLLIVAREFHGTRLLTRHRTINEILKEEIKLIHAMKVKAYNQVEFASVYNK